MQNSCLLTIIFTALLVCKGHIFGLRGFTPSPEFSNEGGGVGWGVFGVAVGERGRILSSTFSNACLYVYSCILIQIY